MTSDTAVPGTVKAAGLLVGIEALAGLAFAVVLLIEGSSQSGVNIYAEAGYFVVLFGGVLACAIGLLLGKRWARGPATAIQILLLGVALYATLPSRQPLFGIPLALVGAAVLVLLFRAPSRIWADGHSVTEDDSK